METQSKWLWGLCEEYFKNERLSPRIGDKPKRRWPV